MRFLFILLSFIVVFSTGVLSMDTYRIGVLGNTTSTIAKAALNTIELLSESHSNTINPFKLEAVFFDESDGSVKDKIKSTGFLMAVIGCFSEDHKDIFENIKDTALISICSQCSRFTDNDNAFRVVASEIELARILARVAIAVLGRKQFSIVYEESNEEYEKMANAYIETIKANGAVVDHVKTVAPDRTDFTKIIMFIRDKRSRVIYFIGSPEQAALFAKQSRKMNTGAVFTSTSDIFNRSFIRKAKKGAEGAEFVTKTPPSVWRIKKLRKFMSKYSGKYETSSRYIPYVYDTTGMILEALDTGKRERKEIIEYMKNNPYKGVLGEMSFNENRENTNPEFYFYIIRRKEFLHMKFDVKKRDLYKRAK